MLKNFRNTEQQEREKEGDTPLEEKEMDKKECHGCRSYNPKCTRGACNLNPYRWKDIEKKKEEMIHREMKRLKSLICFTKTNPS